MGKLKHTHFKSEVTGNLYPVDEYRNHGYGGIKMCFIPNEGTMALKDLPADEYPYTHVYEEDKEKYWKLWLKGEHPVNPFLKK